MISNEMDPLVVNSGAAALDLIARQSSTLDMILMDITLGDMEGFDVIQTIRRNGVTTPVIIISGRNEDYDFMYGLSLGADDYVTKPFRPQILGAKVKALIRRSKSFSQENNQQISCGPFLCDTTTMRFYKNNVELNLSEKDYWWYLNLRKYGGTKHAGYGLGFERIIMYLTGVSNIRDVIPYPRTVGNAEF